MEVRGDMEEQAPMRLFVISILYQSLRPYLLIVERTNAFDSN